MTVNPTRLGYGDCLRLLEDRLREPAPGRIQLLTGPRQVGKTTLLLELAAHLGDTARYAAGDEPAAALPGFWERLWADAEERAGRAKAFLFIDEIQHLPDWSGRLKSRWDRLRRQRIPLHVAVSGSSSPRMGSGSRESLAGRFERLTLSHWTAAALAEAFDLSPPEAARAVVETGSYPGAFELRADLTRWRAYVRDAIVEPAIGRDVLALGVVRRPALLRQVFAVAAGMPAQVVSLQKLRGAMHDRGAIETVAHYLELLEDAYLVAALEKYGARVHRRRAAPPKLVTLNNALLSAMHPEGPPDPARDPARFGAWLENACLAFAWNSGQSVTYWREEPLEVDGVIDGSWGRWAIEVKAGRFTAGELRGLFEFCTRHPRFLPLVVTTEEGRRAAKAAGATGMTWTDFLVSGPQPRS